MSEIDQSGNIMLNTPEDIEFYRMLTLKGALRLELLGMRHSRFSAYKIAKQSYGLTGNKQKVYDQLVELIERKQEEKRNAVTMGT